MLTAPVLSFPGKTSAAMSPHSESRTITVFGTMKVSLAAILSGLLFGCAVSPQMPETALTREPQFHQSHFQMGDLDRQPLLFSRVEPQFIQDGRYHECITGFIVNSEGIPTEVQVTKATDLNFARACVEAISCWRFEPARKGAANVPCVMFVPLVIGKPPGKLGEKDEPLIPRGKSRTGHYNQLGPAVLAADFERWAKL